MPQIVLRIRVAVEECLNAGAPLPNDLGAFQLPRPVLQFSWIVLHIVEFVWTCGETPNILPAVVADQTQIFTLVKDGAIPVDQLSAQRPGIAPPG